MCIINFPAHRCRPGRPWLVSHTIIHMETLEQREAIRDRVRITRLADLHGIDPAEFSTYSKLPPRETWAEDYERSRR